MGESSAGLTDEQLGHLCSTARCLGFLLKPDMSSCSGCTLRGRVDFQDLNDGHDE